MIWTLGTPTPSPFIEKGKWLHCGFKKKIRGIYYISNLQILYDNLGPRLRPVKFEVTEKSLHGYYKTITKNRAS